MTSLRQSTAVTVDCNPSDGIINASCPFYPYPISLRCDSSGIFLLSCSVNTAPSCDVVHTNIQTSCDVVDYSSYDILCRCKTYFTKDNTVPGVLEFSSSISRTNASYSFVFYADPDESKGSITVHISLVYCSFILFFIFGFALKLNKKNKVKPGYQSRSTSPSEVINEYLEGNFFNKIFGGIYSNSSLYRRAFPIILRELRFLRGANNNDETTPV